MTERPLARLLHRLLGRLLGKRCFCGARCRDIDAHKALYHTREEIQQMEARR